MVVAGELVGSENDAYAADAEKNTDDLGPVVADLEEKKGDYHDDYDGPEVDELGGEDGGLKMILVLHSECFLLKMATYVSVCKNDKVIALNVHERKNEESPSFEDYQATPALETVLVNRVARVDQVEKNVVEERLESRYRSSLGSEQTR